MTKIKVEWEAFKNGHRYDVIIMEGNSVAGRCLSLSLLESVVALSLVIRNVGQGEGKGYLDQTCACFYFHKLIVNIEINFVCIHKAFTSVGDLFIFDLCDHSVNDGCYLPLQLEYCRPYVKYAARLETLESAPFHIEKVSTQSTQTMQTFYKS